MKNYQDNHPSFVAIVDLLLLQKTANYVEIEALFWKKKLVTRAKSVQEWHYYFRITNRTKIYFYANFLVKELTDSGCYS